MGPQLVSSAVRAQTSDTTIALFVLQCPRDKFLEMVLSLETQAQNKPHILSPGASYDQPSNIISELDFR